MFRVHPPGQSNSVGRPYDQPTAAGPPQVGQSSQVTRSLGSTMVPPTSACPAEEALLALLGAGAHANDGSVPSGARLKRRRSGRLFRFAQNGRWGDSRDWRGSTAPTVET